MYTCINAKLLGTVELYIKNNDKCSYEILSYYDDDNISIMMIILYVSGVRSNRMDVIIILIPGTPIA